MDLSICSTWGFGGQHGCCNNTDFLDLKIKVDERAQLVKAVSTKPDDLCFIPGTHMVDRENWPPQVIL